MSPWRVGKTHLLDLLSGWDASEGTAYSALAARIRLLIVDGRIVPGARLPSERDLAAGLAVSRTTVNSAYSALRAEGYLQSKQGSGSVAQIPGRPPELPVRTPGRRHRSQSGDLHGRSGHPLGGGAGTRPPPTATQQPTATNWQGFPNSA